MSTTDKNKLKEKFIKLKSMIELFKIKKTLTKDLDIENKEKFEQLSISEQYDCLLILNDLLFINNELNIIESCYFGDRKIVENVADEVYIYTGKLLKQKGISSFDEILKTSTNNLVLIMPDLLRTREHLLRKQYLEKQLSNILNSQKKGKSKA